ncbi:hypothetical protein CJU72_15445 [Pseudomonas fragi]|nr:hypothetical protein CJU72_15445 [Pseudomonas fragi]
MPEYPQPCGSWLACDADDGFYLPDPVDAIAGKPAPTRICVRQPIFCLSPAATGNLRQAIL